MEFSGNAAMSDILLSCSGEFDEGSFLYADQNLQGNMNMMLKFMRMSSENEMMTYNNEHEFLGHSGILANANYQTQCSSPDSLTNVSSSSSTENEDSTQSTMVHYLPTMPLNFTSEIHCQNPNLQLSHTLEGEKETQRNEEINKRKENGMLSHRHRKRGRVDEDEEHDDSHYHDKSRCKRGSATDPQSVYARKRREKINERLKVLQNLVPNGTKVDISTMLEQAIQYVKFMQLQIKLLSSDENWMYTPIAFNGCIADIPNIGEGASHCI